MINFHLDLLEIAVTYGNAKELLLLFCYHLKKNCDMKNIIVFKSNFLRLLNNRKKTSIYAFKDLILSEISYYF